MKHGPIALIADDMPVVSIAVRDHVYDKMISNIEQVIARSGTVIAVATEGDTAIADKAQHILYVPPAPPLLTPVLTVISDFVGIVGGGIIAVFELHVASSVYWRSIIDALFIQDAWMGLIKPFVFCFIIVTVGCHVGLQTRGGTQGVGRATTSAVVRGSVAVLAVDFFLTRLLMTVMY